MILFVGTIKEIEINFSDSIIIIIFSAMTRPLGELILRYVLKEPIHADSLGWNISIISFIAAFLLIMMRRLYKNKRKIK
jgi:uncharacterized protein involved in response to NO